MRTGKSGVRAGVAVAGVLALLAVGCESYNNPPPPPATTTTQTTTTPDISGAWDLTLISTTGGNQQIIAPGSTMTLTQSGTAISGNATFGDIMGSVDANRNVKLNIDLPNDPNKLTLSGTVGTDNKRMSGTWTYQGGASGTWTADKR